MLYRNPRKGDIIRNVKDNDDVRVCKHDGNFNFFTKEHWEFVTVVPESKPEDAFLNVYMDVAGRLQAPGRVYPSRKEADTAVLLALKSRVACLNLVNYVGVYDESCS